MLKQDIQTAMWIRLKFNRLLFSTIFHKKRRAKMVKVTPKNDLIRKLVKHPTAGAFRPEGSSDWPDDSFTARRVADGDVTIETAEKKHEKSDTKFRARSE
jgi:hypothetical protein